MKIIVIPLLPWAKLLYLPVSGIGWGEKNEKLDAFLLSSNAFFDVWKVCRSPLSVLCMWCIIIGNQMFVNYRAVHWVNLKYLLVEGSLASFAALCWPWFLDDHGLPFLPCPSGLFSWEVCSPFKVWALPGGQRKCHSFQITYLKLIYNSDFKSGHGDPFVG